ncbi:hypothetical protein [Streptomyces globisporus]|uniref:hypothetical protein n=1 Tax=Streptomyces globisporus TaxID=1908 RepID=UPI00379145A9
MRGLHRRQGGDRALPGGQPAHGDPVGVATERGDVALHPLQRRDPATETNLLLALTGFTPLIELDVIGPRDALAAIDAHLDRLFSGT